MINQKIRKYFQIPGENKLPLSILDENSFNPLLFKIIYDGNEIFIQPKNLNNANRKLNKILLKELLSKTPKYVCQECKNEIDSFNIYMYSFSKKYFLCHKCVEIIKEKENYISLVDYISKCQKHDNKYEIYCVNCNKNMCEKCHSEHKILSHDFIYLSKITPKYGDISFKKKCCSKAKKIVEIFKNISEIKLIEKKEKEYSDINAFVERLSNEIKYAELIISSFQYFFDKNSLCYELISNFNELNFNEKISQDINIGDIFQNSKNLLLPSFHIIMKSPDSNELTSSIIIPLCQRKKIESKRELNGEIRGIVELKDGFILAGTKEADIGVFDLKNLHLEYKLEFKNLGITQINQLSKIKDDKLELVAVASNLNDIIIISVFHEGKNGENIFNYKLECQVKSHSDKINRIIQLSNNLIVSSSSDGYVIFWKLIKNNNSISLESNSKINLEINVHNLIECKYLNELICNSFIIDLKSLTVKKSLEMWFSQDELFNCATCLFNKKYLAYVCSCDGVSVINLENESKTYFISAKYDYVDAVYTIDDETICLCTRDLYNFFQPKYSQQYRLIENDFKEIGKICYTGTCNYYMNDSEGNFIMGLMDGTLTKYFVE